MAPLNPPITDWRGRRVWVVGASSGIGAALAQSLVAKGARVVASARRLEALSALRPAPERCLCVDITRDDSVITAVREVCAESFDAEIVFWVAGTYHPMASDQLDLERVRETLDVNLMAGYRGIKHTLDAWKRQPHIARHWIWVSSVAGYRGLPQAAAYGASKSALTYLAEVNYLELKPKGIAVSVVCPGFVKTRLTDRNDFEMPAIITADEAAKQTLAGLARGEFEIHYPRRFTRLLKLLSLLPYRLYFMAVRKTLK